MVAAKLIVPYQPAPQPRPRVTRYGSYTPKRVLPWKQAVKAAWIEQIGFPQPLEGVLACDLVLALARPRGHYQASGKLKPHAPEAPISETRGGKGPTCYDLDNLSKSVIDALQDVQAFGDDAQFAAGLGIKAWADDLFDTRGQGFGIIRLRTTSAKQLNALALELIGDALQDIPRA